MPETAPDLTEFKRLGRRDQRKPCGVTEAIAHAPRKDQVRLLAAFSHDDPEIRAGARNWMQQRNLTPPTDSAVSSHRRQRCKCNA